jgi:transposase
MSGISKIKIKESIETLKSLLNEQKTSESFQKVQVLYLLKSQQVNTITEVAEIVGKHRVTIQNWLRCYENEGIAGILKEKRGGGRKLIISAEIIEKLREKIEKTSEFSSYQEIQTWLEREFQLKVSYDVVYYLVRKKMKLFLLVKKPKNNLLLMFFNLRKLRQIDKLMIK